MKILLSTSAVAVALLVSSPAFAMSDSDCEQAFIAADTNKDSTLSEAEASRYFAAHRVANKPVSGATISRTDFLANCKSDLYTPAAVEAGAPFKGANSFTESQAKDRAISSGLTDVSSLAKDDDGIWRGTAVKSGQKVKVAVDYKGNVVSN